MVQVGEQICRLNGVSYRYPDELPKIRQALKLLNQTIIGGCVQEGSPQGWSNFYPPTCIGILYIKVDDYTYQRAGTIGLND